MDNVFLGQTKSQTRQLTSPLLMWFASLWFLTWCLCRDTKSQWRQCTNSVACLSIFSSIKLSHRSVFCIENNLLSWWTTLQVLDKSFNISCTSQHHSVFWTCFSWHRWSHKEGDLQKPFSVLLLIIISSSTGTKISFIILKIVYKYYMKLCLL